MRLASFAAATIAVGIFALVACGGSDGSPSPAPTASEGGDASTIADDLDASCVKLCNGTCALSTDPTTGCGGSNCEPCPSFPHRPGVCNTSGACGLGTCEKGFLDCNDQPGCETNGATDPKNCGSCDTTCGKLHTTASTCELGHCKLTCTGTFAHCTDDPANGCETDTAVDPLNCGTCGKSCMGGTCVAGACQ